MASRAAFTHRRVFKHHTFRLFAVTRGALLVQSRHREAARRFRDVEAVRIMALHAVHPAFAYRMMLREIELRVCFEMTREARLWVFARIDDELPSRARGDVLAARTVTRFATGTAGHLGALTMQTRMRTR